MDGPAALRDPAFLAVRNSNRAIFDIESPLAARLAHPRDGLMHDVAVLRMHALQVSLIGHFHVRRNPE